MGQETATVIGELIESWPLQSDKVRQGAGHLRTIKTVLKNTFPNATAPITASPEALNSIPANFNNTLVELLKHVVPRGSILAWGGSASDIPVGYNICDGSTVSGYGVVPDLRNMFILGAGSGTVAVGTSGGSVSKTTTAGGGHTPVVQGHALTASENGPHDHTGATFDGSSDDNADPGSLIETSNLQNNGTRTSSSFKTSVSGSGAPHSHGADTVPDHTHSISDIRPPWYALAYIIKTSSFVAP